MAAFAPTGTNVRTTHRALHGSVVPASYLRESAFRFLVRSSGGQHPLYWLPLLYYHPSGQCQRTQRYIVVVQFRPKSTSRDSHSDRPVMQGKRAP